MHAISSYHGNRPTNIHTHTHTHTDRERERERERGPITIHCAAASLARSVISLGKHYAQLISPTTEEQLKHGDPVI